MFDCDVTDLKELQRCAWIYARLINKTHVCIRFSTGTEEGLGDNHPNLGKWGCHVDIENTTRSVTSFSGTVVSCLYEIKKLISEKLGPGYL
jgi:hypothetical protein